MSTTFTRSVAISGLLSLALFAAAPAAQAGDLYRYKDPFGVWRSMVVPTGMAKHYKRGQIRAGGGYAMAGASAGFCGACGLSGHGKLHPAVWGGAAFSAARIDALRGHPGLAALDAVITRASKDSGVDRALLSAVIAVESGFRKDARSPKGALGLMQLMPSTAASLVSSTDLETALIDPATNVAAGSRHLRRLIDQYPGRLDLALAAYNAGEGAVRKYDAVPPYAETQQYVRQVMALYAWYHADS